MPGNEIEVCNYLLKNLNLIKLRHLGKVSSIKAPGYGEILSYKELNYVRTEDSKKKADIYINGIGISIKQSGGSFSFNRILRANIIDLFNYLEFNDIDKIAETIDSKVKEFHEDSLESRNIPWDVFFEEIQFKSLCDYLMMKGSPKIVSEDPAELILEAPSNNISYENIKLYNFEEYFNTYKNKLKIALRRSWIGQNSKSEHGRAVSISRNSNNTPWVFDDVAGTPSSGWAPSFPEENRKTVYFLMIEKVN